MSQPDPDPKAPSEEDDEVAPTPFDNPFFLPVIFVGFAIWLGYDGFLNAKFIADHQTPDTRWVIGFNRWGALVCGLLAAYFGWRGLEERKRSTAQEPPA